MSKTIQFIPEKDRLLLKYSPRDASNPGFVEYKLNEAGEVWIRRVFLFGKNDLVSSKSEEEYTFLFGVTTEKDYFLVKKEILDLKHDLRLAKEMKLSDNTFIASTGISIFKKIDELVNEPIVVGGNADGAIPPEAFDELLANFPTTTEMKYYAQTRVTRVLKDYLSMSDAQTKMDTYLKKKTIRNPSKIDFIKDYEPKKFEYVRDEISAMLQEIERNPNEYTEQDWQRQIVEFILLIFPKYIAVLEKVNIKDFYPKGYKGKTKREIDLMLVDANGSVDIIEVKRPHPYQLLSRKANYRGNYIPSRDFSEAVMQVEKYLFHLSKWGQIGELAIQENFKKELPADFKIRISNPKAMIILGRDKNFSPDELFDFEIIKRKYANIADIITYDDLLRRLKNIITMIPETYSKLETNGRHVS